MQGKLNEVSLHFLEGAIPDLNTRADVLDCPSPPTAFPGSFKGFEDRLLHHLLYSSSDGWFLFVKVQEGFRPDAVDTRVVRLVCVAVGLESPKMLDLLVNLCQCEISLTSAFEMVHNRLPAPLRSEALSNTIVYPSEDFALVVCSQATMDALLWRHRV